MAISALSDQTCCSQSQGKIELKTSLALVDSDWPQRLADQMERFKVHLLVMRGLSTGTIENHRKIVQKAIRETYAIELTHLQVQQQVIALHRRGCSYYHKVNCIRAFEAYMDFIGNPIHLGRPKKPKRIIKESLTEAEVSLVIAASKNIRERAMVTLLAYTGIRNQELCSVKVSDVDFGQNLLQVISGKGSKSRTVCMSGDCTRVLLDYIAKYPRQANDYLFTTLRKGNQYAPYDLRQLVKKLAKKAGIGKRVHPHLFRHSLASNMLSRGANLLTIKEQLGHADIETTMIYIQSRPQRIQAEYQLYTPSYI